METSYSKNFLLWDNGLKPLDVLANPILLHFCSISRFKRLPAICLLPQKSTETLSVVLFSWGLAQDCITPRLLILDVRSWEYLMVSLKFYSRYQKGRTSEVLMILIQWLSFDWISDMNLTKSEQEIISLAHFHITG